MRVLYYLLEVANQEGKKKKPKKPKKQKLIVMRTSHRVRVLGLNLFLSLISHVPLGILLIDLCMYFFFGNF